MASVIYIPYDPRLRASNLTNQRFVFFLLELFQQQVLCPLSGIVAGDRNVAVLVGPILMMQK
ncbi:MAG: hypothetical protein HP495_07305 [Nitrospira sp.]|nr:hypothetical protein [Nitrospira sp.]